MKISNVFLAFFILIGSVWAIPASIRLYRRLRIGRESERVESDSEGIESDAEDVPRVYRSGIKPERLLTQDEISTAKAALRHDHQHSVHIAICGGTGTGKSSLVNALRGLGPRDEGAAKVGVVETTKQRMEYPDLRAGRDSFSRVVWHDLPGADARILSSATSSGQEECYFISQKLYAFDFVIVVYGMEFMETEIETFTNCFRLGVPVLVVRSKADQHVRNMWEDDDREQDKEYYQKEYEGVSKGEFGKILEQVVRRAEQEKYEGYERVLEGGVLEQSVYVVSRDGVLGVVRGKRDSGIGPEAEKGLIDEKSLLGYLEHAVRQRLGIPAPALIDLGSSWQIAEEERQV